MIEKSPKLTPKQEQAVIALMGQATVAAAAKAAGVAEVTLYRWLREPVFKEAWQNARRQALDSSISVLQSAAGVAVATLERIAKDAGAPTGSQVAASRALLEFAFRGSEIMDLEVRIAGMEASLTELQRFDDEDAKKQAR